MNHAFGAAPVSRRNVLKLTGAAAVAALTTGNAFADDAGPSKAMMARLQKVHDRLAAYMTELAAGAKKRISDGVTLLMPQAGGGYVGVWPDDSLYPMMAMPSLAKKDELAGVIRFLTDSVVELDYVPDRVEPDGLPILSPGGSTSKPMTERMPLHLPAAWVRLLDYYQSFGVEIPRKKDWAAVIERSVRCVPFANGLAYADPQKMPIGFGFHDSIKITGSELMSSLMLMRGLERATKLFANEAEPKAIEKWTRLAKSIHENLHRLYDPNIGGYVGGTRAGRQFSVWANGLIYSLAKPEFKKKIVQFYRDNKNKIFLLGCVRQIAEPGWNNIDKSKPQYNYQNGGFWATGAGYVLPAIADQDPELAVALAEELADNLPEIQYAEWIDLGKKPSGAFRFLASVSLPLLGLKSILERRPLIEYF